MGYNKPGSKTPSKGSKKPMKADLPPTPTGVKSKPVKTRTRHRIVASWVGKLHGSENSYPLCRLGLCSICGETHIIEELDLEETEL